MPVANIKKSLKIYAPKQYNLRRDFGLKATPIYTIFK